MNILFIGFLCTSISFNLCLKILSQQTKSNKDLIKFININSNNIILIKNDIKNIIQNNQLILNKINILLYNNQDKNHMTNKLKEFIEKSEIDGISGYQQNTDILNENEYVNISGVENDYIEN